MERQRRLAHSLLLILPFVYLLELFKLLPLDQILLGVFHLRFVHLEKVPQSALLLILGEVGDVFARLPKIGGWSRVLDRGWQVCAL